MRSSRISLAACVAAAIALPGCGSDNDKLLSDADYEAQAILDVKAFIQENLDGLAAASVELQAAAPEADDDGWSAASDAAAVEAMKTAWKKARQAYEHVEGAIAVVFPDIDVSTDARYDAFIEAAPDDNLFDGEGVTGVHAIERILWSDAIPADVLVFEQGLANYTPAAFPATKAEAEAFKTALCGRLVADTKKMQDEFRGLALDAPSAYRGVIGSIREQVEKLDKAAVGEEESRYAQYTLADMRANIEAGRVTYDAFKSWVLTKPDGDAIDAAIVAGFDRLIAGYADFKGDTLPEVPEDWSAENPTPEQLETPFGKLFLLVQRESDDATDGTLAHEMTASADLLGIAQLQ